ncbi:hypothetical protein [Marinobacterium mangrovicola]|uniref:Uncharacterized protein n=1 Tax=Marinobacterium mangrovicola TaxID=1476959 RepID=A0A4R1GDK8_9GAMM|nr:hypothetical protein [Marinobacterium mangrovicola]TCK02322.1 hypothetical protein CLV83_4505 [Marinobacterium mangrovicola]
MVGESDNKDKNESRKIAIILISLVLLVGVAIALILPALGDIIAVHFEPGLGLKSAAVIAFFVTVATLLVFAIASGDGLLGELQFMLAGFFVFFLIFWLMIAWIF